MFSSVYNNIHHANHSDESLRFVKVCTVGEESVTLACLKSRAVSQKILDKLDSGDCICYRYTVNYTNTNEVIPGNYFERRGAFLPPLSFIFFFPLPCLLHSLPFSAPFPFAAVRSLERTRPRMHFDSRQREKRKEGPFSHTRSQDFLSGAPFFPEKVDFFTRRRYV